jgi:Chromo (CHRromatin Organisation MOdifier) domain
MRISTPRRKSTKSKKILDQRVRNGITEYLIQWKGYTLDDNSWEPTKNLNCPDKVKEFKERNKQRYFRDHQSVMKPLKDDSSLGKEIRLVIESNSAESRQSSRVLSRFYLS